VAGYALLTGADEKARSDASKRLRLELGDPKIAEHGGRIVKTTGNDIPDLQRQNLTPLEEAAASTKLIHKGATIDDVGRDLCPWGNKFKHAQPRHRPALARSDLGCPISNWRARTLTRQLPSRNWFDRPQSSRTMHGRDADGCSGSPR